MKKSALLILFSATLLIACKNGDKQAEVEAPLVVVQEQVDAIFSSHWMNEIQLNNGTTWEANIETTQGVEKMQEVLKTHATSSMESYHQLAGDLNDLKNTLVKECSMTGASHDNLHVWLMPLIAKIEALSDAKTMEDAAKLKQGIEENINAYSDYFN